MKKLYPLVLLAFSFYFATAQPVITPVLQQLQPLSSYDSLKLSQLPVYTMPEQTTRRLLPYALDNSQLPWMRPLVAQAGLECGQASSIGICFTYEIDYLRNVPANVPENQYATHFAYNFVNGGSDAGVSFYETYEILKKAGNPTVADYGGMATGGPSRWMTGYNLYYNAMHNRVTEVYSIKVNTPEGLQTFKNWLYDHGDGSTAGGLGCFYAQYTNPQATFPNGTPEAGKHVIYSWGGSANHSMTIVGYNDSIRWDYNGDSLYTNNIDLNADGLLDMRDWEIGGFKLANTYGSIGTWGENGFAYMMYKSVADAYQQGGIWNNTIVIIDVKDNYEPQLTAKVNLNYECRNQLRVTAGVATDPAAAEPEFILHFPIFDYQGGCKPMQGNTGPSSIEFGLDLNLLLQYVTPGQSAKYFLMVEENDPLGTHSGTLVSFSLIDYTNGGAVINSQSSDIPLINNGITMASVIATVNHYPVTITTDTIEPLTLYANFSEQLEATAGTPPYRWHIAEDYARLDSTSVMQAISEVKLQLSSTSNGRARVELPFEFPFYGQKYTELYATVDGFLLFENTLTPWPFYLEGRTFFIQTPMIAPMMSNPFIAGSSSDGVWYEEAEDYVTFRWKLSVYDVTGSFFNATARLYPDGRIELNYGECVLPYFLERFSGISDGTGLNYELITYDPDFTPVTNQLVRYTPVTLHDGISLSDDGILSGQVTEIITNIPVNVCATDKNNLKDYRTFYLNSNGLLMEYQVNAGDDGLVSFGESITMSLQITNLNSFPVGQLNYTLSTFDPYFQVVQGTGTSAGLQPGETITVDNIFALTASTAIPDEHISPFLLIANAAEGNWSRSLNITSYRPVTQISSLEVVDGNNGILEPGETVLMNMEMVNAGGATLTNAVAQLSSNNEYLTIFVNDSETDTLVPGGIWQMTYGMSLSDDAPQNVIVQLTISITGDNQFSFQQTFPLYTGQQTEDFETADFTAFEWTTGGNASWYVEEGSAYEGSYCARSGLITDNQVSYLSLDWNIAYTDSISFYMKVSSEASYDYLRFLVNQDELNKWSGAIDWTKASFVLPAGEKTFIWKYTKDYSISAGDDCARIDYIIFPAFAIPTKAENNVITQRMVVYPNPAAGEITVSCLLTNPSPLKVFISDARGRMVYEYSTGTNKVSGEYTFKPAVDNWLPGIYTIIMVTDGGILSRKLIRTH